LLWFELCSIGFKSKYRGFKTVSKNIDKAQAKLNEMNMTEEERRAYEKYLINMAREKDMLETAMEEGIKKGEKKGKIEGKIEEKIEVALVMIAEGESNEKIKKYTGLTFEQIDNLRAK
jgi:predicted transposase/invertase (TIGR01784 family)